MLSNGEDFEDMAEYGKQKEDWLRKYIPLANGIPSHDTFNRVFQLIDPEELKRCLASDGSKLLNHLKGSLINLDGKKIKGASPKSKGNDGLFILSAWVSKHRFCIGQEKVEEKSNEITAIPKVLEKLELKGSTVSIDAIGCQKDIAELIVDKEGYYLLAVKGNQPTLLKEIKESFDTTQIDQSDQDWDYGHGRYEERACSVLDAEQSLSSDVLAQWKGVKSIVHIEAKRFIGDENSCKSRFYISNRPDTSATQFNELTREHWSVENQLHWHLDVTFSEDACRARTGHAAENLNIMRKVALHRLINSKAKVSVKKRRFRASLNQDFLEEVLDL